MKILENIMNYLKKIFSKQKKLNSGEIKQDVLTKQENTFVALFQKDSKDYINKKSILDEINKNPNLIYSLPYSRLVQLNRLYEERINELERRIEQA